MMGISTLAIGRLGGFSHLGIGHGIFSKLLLIGLLGRLGLQGFTGRILLLVIMLIILGVILFLVYRHRKSERM
jgi:hypothetical protein